MGFGSIFFWRGGLRGGVYNIIFYFIFDCFFFLSLFFFIVQYAIFEFARSNKKKKQMCCISFARIENTLYTSHRFVRYVRTHKPQSICFRIKELEKTRSSFSSFIRFICICIYIPKQKGLNFWILLLMIQLDFKLEISSTESCLAAIRQPSNLIKLQKSFNFTSCKLAAAVRI